MTMMLFSKVTGPPTRDIALPSSLAPVPMDTPEKARMVPFIWAPALMVAALLTCQKTFLARAPLVRTTLTLLPTVRELADWKTHDAFGSPLASSVRSTEVMLKEVPVQ